MHARPVGPEPWGRFPVVAGEAPGFRFGQTGVMMLTSGWPFRAPPTEPRAVAGVLDKEAALSAIGAVGHGPRHRDPRNQSGKLKPAANWRSALERPQWAGHQFTATGAKMPQSTR